MNWFSELVAKIKSFFNKLTGSSDSGSSSSNNSNPSLASEEKNGFYWDKVVFLSDNASGANQLDDKTVLNSVSFSSSQVKISFNMNPSWPEGGPDSNKGMQALIYAFKKDSDNVWRGTKFDWIRKGGQSTKLLENIHAGYRGWAGNCPVSGQSMAIVWVSVNGTKSGSMRSNAAFGKWA